MFYSNISLCTNTSKCSNTVNMDDIVFSATVNILGNEFKYCIVYKIYYNIYFSIIYIIYLHVCVSF